MTLKWLLSFIIVLSCIYIAKPNAYCSESYYINNNRVLLYKIINWWNDSLPEDSNRFCGRLIKYQNEDQTIAEYNESQMTLMLKIKGGFADLLAIFKQCEQCFGPSYLQCTWLNQKYFGNGKGAIVHDQLPTINTLIFYDIDKKAGQFIQSIEKDIELELKGVIGGLLLENGRIALHPAGNFLKACPRDSQSLDDRFPISLKIINSQTDEVLAKYSAIWKH